MKTEPTTDAGLRERLAAARSLADTLDARGTRCMDSDLCAAAGLLRLLAEHVAGLEADRDRRAQEINLARDGSIHWAIRARDAEAAIARVWELHARDDSNPLGAWCGTCTTSWPCRTAEALDATGEA